MRRENTIMEVATPMLAELFTKSREKIAKYYEQHAGELADELLSGIRSVAAQVKDQQANNQKGPIKYILLSNLHSGMMLGHSRIRIEALDSGLYCDTAEAAAHLDLDGIYQFFETDIAEIKKELVWEIPRLRGYEEDVIRYKYESYYHSAAKEFLKGILSEPDIDIMMKEVEREDEVRILFGEYMGTAELLGKLAKGVEQ